MNKIKIKADLYQRLVSLQNGISVSEGAEMCGTAVENMEEAKRICKELSYSLSDLENALYDAEYAIYDRDVEGGVEKMEQYVKKLCELEEDVAYLKNHIAGSVKTFVEATEPDDFAVIVSQEEIERVIEENSEKFQIMSLGYRDGQYALIFGEDEESIDVEPFVFAVGREDEYESVRQFVETFLDLEDPYEE